MTYSRNNEVYHVLDFDNVNEKGLQALSKAFTQKGDEVTAVSATNRAKRVDGLPVKTADLFFLNGQKAQIRIGEQGDIISVKLNSKVIPFSAKSESDFVSSLSDSMKRNQPAFNKSLVKKAAKLDGGTAQKRPASRSQATRIKEIDDLIAEAEKNLQEAKARLAELESQRSDLRDSINQLKDKIVAMDKTIAELNAEAQRLGVTA